MLAIAKITTDIFLSSTDTFPEDANTRAVRLAGKDAAGAAAGTVLAGNNAAAAGPSSSNPASSPAKTAHPSRRDDGLCIGCGLCRMHMAQAVIHASPFRNE